MQGRLDLWQPKRALVTGAGTIGLLATLALRLRGLEVTTCARRAAPTRNSALVERLGARYVSTAEIELPELAERDGPFDIVFEGSGAPVLIEPCVAALAPNGVLALFSVTPGSALLTVDMARLNQALVLYNRVIVGSAAAAWDDYAGAVGTIGLAQADEAHPAADPSSRPLALHATAQETSPLVAAASKADTAQALDLLREGADPNGTSSDGTTAIHWAAYHDDFELARTLVEAGAEVWAWEGNGHVEQVIAETGCSPDTLPPIALHFKLIRIPPKSTLFPSSTLFRSPGWPGCRRRW